MALSRFHADTFKLNLSRRNVKLVGITVLPSLLVSMKGPEMYHLMIKFAGTVPVAFLWGVMPPLVYWKMLKGEGEAHGALGRVPRRGDARQRGRHGDRGEVHVTRGASSRRREIAFSSYLYIHNETLKVSSPGILARRARLSVAANRSARFGLKPQLELAPFPANPNCLYHAYVLCVGKGAYGDAGPRAAENTPPAPVRRRRRSTPCARGPSGRVLPRGGRTPLLREDVPRARGLERVRGATGEDGRAGPKVRANHARRERVERSFVDERRTRRARHPRADAFDCFCFRTRFFSRSARMRRACLCNPRRRPRLARGARRVRGSLATAPGEELATHLHGVGRSIRDASAACRRRAAVRVYRASTLAFFFVCVSGRIQPRARRFLFRCRRSAMRRSATATTSRRSLPSS